MGELSTYIKVTNFDYTNTPVASLRPKFNYRLADHEALPLLTIVTPFYNTGEVFYETAQSVLQQSFQQFEWIIINDGSNELKSIEILESFRKRDSRIRVIDHNKNLGLPYARNTGIKEAKSPYILFLDSDDLLETTAAEKWYWFMITNPDCAFVKGYTVGFGAQNYLWVRGFHQGKGFLQENLVDVTSLVRKNILERVGGFDESLRSGYEDWDLWLKCADYGFWGATIPEYLNWYRRKESYTVRWKAFEKPRTYSYLMRKRYPKLYYQHFPEFSASPHVLMDNIKGGFNILEKSKPRLMMIIPWLSMGGADKFNLDLVKQLTQRGWEITIATTLISDDPWWQEFTKLTPDVFMLHRFLSINNYPNFLNYLIQSRHPDIILVTNSEFGYALLPSLRSCFPETIFIDYCHMEEEEWQDGGYPMMSLEHQQELDLTLLSSNYLRNWMIKRGGDPDHIRVCHINVDTALWQPNTMTRLKVRQTFGVSDELPIILYAARLCDQKQPLLFAKTIKKLIEKHLNFLAIVAGDGPDRGKLDKFINRNRMKGYVKVLGALGNDQVRELMQASDIFFLPSKWEGIALSIYEAMACGIAVVGADVGGQSELVTQGTGILVKPTGNLEEDARLYAEVLTRLISDHAERENLGRSARSRVVREFNLDMMIDNILSYIVYAKSIKKATIVEEYKCEESKGLAARVAAEYSTRTQTSIELLNNRWEPPSWRLRLYFWLRAKLYPFYNYGKLRRWKWVIKLKEIVAHVLKQGIVEEP